MALKGKRKLSPILLLCISLTFALSGCSDLLSYIHERSLKRDMTVLLHKHKIYLSSLSCKMINNSRSGYCISTVDVHTLSLMIRELALFEVKTAADLQDLTLQKLQDSNVIKGCGALDFFRYSSDVEIYRSDQANQPILLIGGGAFDYILLYYQASSSETCVQVNYAYG